MILILLFGLAALAAAPVVALAGQIGSGDRRRNATDVLAELGIVGNHAPQGRRRPAAVSNGTRTLARGARRLVPPPKEDALAALLARSGVSWRIEEVLALKVAATLLGTTLGFWTAMSNPLKGVAMAVVFGAAGWFGPDLFLRQRGDARTEAIRDALPDALDLMAISVEAGVAFEGALAAAAADLKGPLGQEFDRTLQEMRLGLSRREALVGLKERNGCRELSGFILALLQADALGISVANVLRTQANEMRAVRRRRAREKAAKTPVKLLFPLMFGIFPALLIVVMGPAVIRIMDSLAL